MRYVLTGDSGTLAAELDRLLGERGHERVHPPGQHLARWVSPVTGQHLARWVSPVTGLSEPDFRSGAYLDWLAGERYDVFIHAGALVGSTLCAQYPREVVGCNVTGPGNLARCVAETSDARFVFFATDGEYDPLAYGLNRPVSARTAANPRTEYGRSKQAGRLLVEDELSDRLLEVYPCFGFGGPADGASCVAELLKCASGHYRRRPFIPLDPRRVKEVTPLSFVARATVSALERGIGGRLPLASNWRRPYGEVVDLVSEVTGVELDPVWRPDCDYKGDLIYDPVEVAEAWSLVGADPPDVRGAIVQEWDRVRAEGVVGEHHWRNLSVLESATRSVHRRFKE